MSTIAYVLGFHRRIDFSQVILGEGKNHLMQGKFTIPEVLTCLFSVH